MYPAMALAKSELYKSSLENRNKTPQSYIEYSFHSCETISLSTNKLTTAQILKFRGKAFHTHHSNVNYFTRIESKSQAKV